MADDHIEAHRQAFAHYLRTGQRLTNAEWIARQELKFNPYHDERGRFTSPPGVTQSWGENGNAGYGRSRVQRNAVPASHSRPGRSQASSSRRADDQSAPAVSKTPRTNFRSEFVRNTTTEAGHAETYFELNKRQAGLNRLREAAGANPGATVKADLDDFQKRLDADRARLDARLPVINAQVNEIARAGFVPFDVGAGAFNIVSGNGRVRDYFSVAGVIPVGVTLRRINGIIQLGGAQSVVRRLIKTENLVGLEKNHIPSLDSLKTAKIQIPPSKKPVLAMLPEHHKLTPSWGSLKENKAFREAVAKLLERGKVEEALALEVEGIENIKGGHYDGGLEDMIKYARDNLPNLKR